MADPKHRTAFPLIFTAAEALGVSRPTLYRALRGDPPGHPQLVAGYRKFVTEHLDGVAPHDLTTAQGRSLAFAERMALLTGDPASGGYGMSFNTAMEKMRSTPQDAELLELMGDIEASPAKCDLSCPEIRRQLFNARIDMLTARKADGGEGMTFEEAVAEMKANPLDSALLRAMGALPAKPPAS